MKEDEIEAMTTPPEDIQEKQSEKDRLLALTSNHTKSYARRDRSGLRLSFARLLPIANFDDRENRIWGASIILNAGDLEFPQIDYKLRVSAKKKFDPKLTCNSSKGIIKKDDIFVLAYQLPETSIEAVQLTLLVDCSPYEVPLQQDEKADYYWCGTNTKVPGPSQLIKELQQNNTPKTESTLKIPSPGRIENIPEGMKRFLFEGGGFNSMVKLLHPHCTSVFRDLSEMKIENFQVNGFLENVGSTDVIAQEVVRRFHEANRHKFITTPTLLQ